MNQQQSVIIGQYCNLYKVCTKCDIKKYGKEFPKWTSTICIKCKNRKKRMALSPEKLFEKMEKFKLVNLDISKLTPTEDGLIFQIAVDFKWSKFISFKRAKELVLKGEAQVHNFHTIYMVQNEDGRNAIIRKLVLKRDKNKCYYCGKFGDTVDHIIPVSKGGESTLENLVCACEKCNGLKKDDIMSKKDVKKVIFEELISNHLKPKKNKWE